MGWKAGRGCRAVAARHCPLRRPGLLQAPAHSLHSCLHFSGAGTTSGWTLPTPCCCAGGCSQRRPRGRWRSSQRQTQSRAGQRNCFPSVHSCKDKAQQATPWDTQLHTGSAWALQHGVGAAPRCAGLVAAVALPVACRLQAFPTLLLALWQQGRLATNPPTALCNAPALCPLPRRLCSCWTAHIHIAQPVNTARTACQVPPRHNAAPRNGSPGPAGPGLRPLR